MTLDDWRAHVRARVPPIALAREPEILDELAQHLADLYADAIENGASPEGATATALAALPRDGDDMARRLVHASRTLPGLIADRWIADPSPAPAAPSVSGLLRGVTRDAVYAWRSLRQSPGYVALVLLTFALGIGANSAIFAAVDTILLRPLPYEAADRLVVPVSVNAARGIDNGSVSWADHADWQRETDVFEAVAVLRPVNLDLTGAGQPERVRALQVSRDYFRVITSTPTAGRTLLPADHQPNAPRVAVLSYGLWQRVFGGADTVVGRTIGIGGVPHEIAGVLPARRAWPADAALFVPLPATSSADVLTRRDNLIFFSVARLREDVPLERAETVVQTIASRLEREDPAARAGWTNTVLPLREFMVPEDARRALWVLLAAVGAVLLMGCANLAHLSLVRGLGRARELGIRLALGAGRWRLVRYLAAECVLLAGAGAACGIALAVWMIQGLAAMAPDGTPLVEDLGLDLRVVAMTVALTVVVVLLTGLAPAVICTRVQPGPALKDGSPGAGSSRGVRLLRNGLVVAQVAGAVLLLVGAALLLRSFWRLSHVHPGVEVDSVLTARLSLPRGPRYSSPQQSAAFFQHLTERLRAVPGLESAAATSYVPVGGGGIGLGRVFLADGWPEPPAGPDVSAQWNVVTPAYFGTLDIPVVQGRDFTDDDRADTTPVVIISRSFATQMFGTRNPLGARIRSWRDENLLREIVGVVGDVRYTGLAERDVVRQVYVPHTQNSWGLMNVVVRSAGGAPATLESALRREVGALDANLAVSNVATLRSIASDSVASDRSTTLLLALLAATAVGLGAIGIYGVINHAVSMRRRELGVRAALGATPRHLYGMVLHQTLRLTLAGLLVGIAAAVGMSRLLQRLLYETEPSDPVAYGVTIAVITVAAGLASAAPARRAARADPLTSLKL